MSLYHVMRHKVSFVESSGSADVWASKLDLGDENVHLHT